MRASVLLPITFDVLTNVSFSPSRNFKEAVSRVRRLQFIIRRSFTEPPLDVFSLLYSSAYILYTSTFITSNDKR